MKYLECEIILFDDDGILDKNKLVKAIIDLDNVHHYYSNPDDNFTTLCNEFGDIMFVAKFKLADIKSLLPLPILKFEYVDTRMN